jgi:hypothetical protein
MNKEAEFAEDQYRLGASVPADAAEYRVKPKVIIPVREKKEVHTESPEIQSLRRRIAYFENDTMEDPNVRAHMLRMLRARLSAALKKKTAPAAAPVASAAKKTGWWDPASKEQVTDGAEAQKNERVLDGGRMEAQMDRLGKRAGAMRKELGLSEKDAKAQNEHYKGVRSGIERIRYRLKKLEEGTATDAHKDEIRELRGELARNLKELRRDLRGSKIDGQPGEESGSIEEQLARVDAAAAKLNRTWEKDASEAGRAEQSPYEWHAEPTVTFGSEAAAKDAVDAMPAIPKEDQEEWDAWNSFGAALRDVSEKGAEEEAQRPEQNEEEAAVETQEAEEAEAEVAEEVGEQEDGEKGYEARLALRNEWRSAKRAYDDAYRIYLEDRAYERSRKGILGRAAFWKRESQPQILLDLESAYKDARRVYASSLSEALTSRGEDVDEDQEEGVRAALANRFVLQAAHDRLEAERAFIPQGRDRRVLENLQAVFKKHRFAIRAAGYATVAGIGLASGGIGLAIVALSKKAVQAKISAGLVLGGAFVGAAAGNSISDSLISYNEARRDSALRKARYSFSASRIDALENAYLKGYRGHEAAVRNQKRIIAAGTITGGVLGAMAASRWDDLLTLETPEVPQAPIVTPAPEAPVDVPAPETPEPAAPVETSDDLIPRDELTLDDEFSEYEHEPEDDLPPIESAPETPEVAELPDIPYTFEEGSRIDTVSEALFETWKSDPALVSDHLSNKEFLAQMYGAIAALEEEPVENAELLEAMGITSGDIDEVAVGQTINLQPFFAYMNERL